MIPTTQVFICVLVSGNKYILVFTEYLTKWVDAYGIPNKNAETVVNHFIQFVCAHGVPKELITDQGREFCNQLNDLFCKKMGIVHKVASPYHPQTGGHTERFNRTLTTMLLHYVNDKQNDWDTKLPYVLFAYRTSQHSSTGQTPFFLVYGREARLPVEVELPPSVDSEAGLVDRVNVFLELDCYRKSAAANIKKKQVKQKKHHDKKVRDHVFNEGDEVLLHNTRKLSRKGGKLDPLWTGPYEVQNVLNNGCYRLKGKLAAVNGNRLKRFHKSEKIDRRTVNPDTANQRDKQPEKGSQQYTRNEQERHIPLKKRRLNIDDTQYCEDIMIIATEDRNYISFDPIGHEWQDEKCQMLGVKVRNYHKQGNSRPVGITAEPLKTAQMRGDGNCLFRTLSYMVSGVQSNHNEIRQKVLNFMLTNYELFEGYTDESLTAYLNKTEMWKNGQWGTDVEIRAFATMMKTNVFVYCDYGGRRCWTKYPPIRLTAEDSVYMLNSNNHFEPVIDIKDDLFSKPPYIPIGRYVPRQLKSHVSNLILDAALVNSYPDESTLQQLPICPDVIFVQTFKDKPYTIPGTEHIAEQMDANVFNLLCDQGDLVSYVVKM